MIERLADSPLDIIGDIHGECDALKSLLHHLGYDQSGGHPAGRKLVFVGDLCDRGPDSPGVIALVRRIVEAGNGQAILGNHELNLLRGDRKDGNDWFWDENHPRDIEQYEPYTRVDKANRDSLLAFLDELPLILERDDLRIVHAAWHTPSIARIAANIDTPLHDLFDQWEAGLKAELTEQGLYAASTAEKKALGDALHDPEPDTTIPMLRATAQCDEHRQIGNPIRVVTSGLERQIQDTPYYAAGRWRFVQRVRWWDEYTDDTPIVIGHYWRRLQNNRPDEMKKGPDMFRGIDPLHWHGQRKNVFCVDYSVGARFIERKQGNMNGATTLVALRWPERSMMLDNGQSLNTDCFQQGS